MTAPEIIEKRKEAARARTRRWREKYGVERNTKRRAFAAANPGFFREAAKANYERNKEKRAAANREYYLKNIAKVKATQREYYLKHREAFCARAKTWKQNNREQYLASTAASFTKNKEQIYARKKALRIADPEGCRRVRHNRRARLRGDGCKLSKGLAQQLLILQCKKCVVCKADLRESGYHLDHIMPLARGGKNEDRNIQLLCPSCNLRKHAKDPIVFMQQNGYLL